MNWNERLIATAISRQTLARKCVVLVDNCNWTGAECDVLAVTKNLRIIDVEVKISRADLKADWGKYKWWTSYTRNEETKKLDFHDPRLKQWPAHVWKHYYAMPAEIWKPELLDAMPSKNSGVLLMKEQGHGRIAVATCLRRATPNRNALRLKPEQVIDIARLANLRMWNAYEDLERVRDDCRRQILQTRVTS